VVESDHVIPVAVVIDGQHAVTGFACGGFVAAAGSDVAVAAAGSDVAADSVASADHV
jgi:hypothetical protein